ncbi:MAG: hypothetical protein J6Y13_00520 [Treponema sp.]|nr:hypothetical protein [Treponema sp.]
MRELDLRAIPAFGVAGNFTGHLEQAGEAADFVNVKTAEATAPKALFPTYIPTFAEVRTAFAGITAGKDTDNADGHTAAEVPADQHPALQHQAPNGGEHLSVPSFLHNFPFDSRIINFPPDEEKLQIEPECAVIFDVCWQDDQVLLLTPRCFGASNDCSIRKAGAKKISEKKNWGACSKGFASHTIPLTSFRAGCELAGYRIASFLIREGKAHPYGEDSPVSGYSYIWEKLTDWLVDRLNAQKDEGPAENIHAYLVEAGMPGSILISIGATRYTDFGEHTFLQDGDETVIVLYPGAAYTPDEILHKVEANDLNGPDNACISVLRQTVRT